MVPKLIHPLPPAAHSPGSPSGEDGGSGGEGAGGSGGGEGGGAGPGGGAAPSALDTWMQSVNEERPPTPPRGRATNGSLSLAFFE